MSKTKSAPNHYKPWSSSEEDTLLACLKSGLSTQETANKLGRTKASIWTHKNIILPGGKRFAHSVSVVASSAAKPQKRKYTKRANVEPKAKTTNVSLEDLKGLAKRLGCKIEVTFE